MIGKKKKFESERAREVGKKEREGDKKNFVQERRGGRKTQKRKSRRLEGDSRE